MVKVRRGYKSDNVRVTGRTGGGGGLRIPQSRGGKAGAGVGGAGLLGVIVVVVMSLLGGGGGGIDLGSLGLDATAGTGASGLAADDLPEMSDEDLAEWSATFDDIQNTWIDIFEAAGLEYRISTLTIFNGSTSTQGCGNSVPAEVGPFYCPADDGVYFDPSFFRQLATRFGAPGDFAISYVLAHEIGHHIQNLTGVSSQVRQQQQGASQLEQNDLGIRIELQADCLAGIWAFEATQRPRTFEGNDNILYLERGDLEEGLRAAEAVGDDSIQEMSGVAIDPHQWNHGSAEQRQAWLTLGLETGDPAACNDTFSNRTSGIEIMPQG